jgi:uncharacterized protein (TIGR02246 family)
MADDHPGTAPRHAREADEAAIRALIARQIDCWNVADPDGYAKAYTEDGDCVSFLGAHYRGRAAIAASSEVPRRASLLRRLIGTAQLAFQITHLRFLTPDVAVVHAVGGLASGSRPARSQRTNTSIAVRTDDGWFLAVSQNTTRRPAMETVLNAIGS